jgi:hypothetical protein
VDGEISNITASGGNMAIPSALTAHIISVMLDLAGVQPLNVFILILLSS